MQQITQTQSGWAAIAVAICCLFGNLQAQPPRSMQIDLDQGRFVGMPIHWGKVDGALLDRSGRIRQFEQREVRQHQLLDEVFAPASLAESRAQLQAEMGSAYETQVTGPYVIATPRGESGRWENCFRTLMAGYTRYFNTRGWPIRSPDFPLIIIVLADQQAFLQKAALETKSNQLLENVAGIYVPHSNRCLLFNLGGKDATNWEATQATIVHEAVHQLAYNTGVHERLFQHPLWVIEGLATMFEVPAVYDVRLSADTPLDRIHSSKAREVIGVVGKDSSILGEKLEDLVASDHLFRVHTSEAYALAWALTYYLAERMPKQYFEYIALQRQRGFEAYPAEARQMDFRKAFAMSPTQLAPHLLRALVP
jgi:Protein of unknown function (DUF1570)